MTEDEIQEIERRFPIVHDLRHLTETEWFNPKKTDTASALLQCPVKHQMMNDAAERLERFAPYIAKVFPQTEESHGLIESPLIDVRHMKTVVAQSEQIELSRLMMKCDSQLPISGSIKARGGIYEVLAHAEVLAQKNNLLDDGDDYSQFTKGRFKDCFSQHKLIASSTGNLGLSIGTIGSALGFSVTIHMSSDARTWKKDRLRSLGVTVVEHAGDYSEAVRIGRRQAQDDSYAHFIDDEASMDLFLGYSVAALRLKEQLESQDILVDKTHPLFVYLPCGVGGAPGGITFGLKSVFGDAVHCFFIEPVHAPAMLLGMSTGLHDGISVQDIGIDNVTIADGLAVGRPSRVVGKLMEPFISGILTVSDQNLLKLLVQMKDGEDIELEPSALAGCVGPGRLLGTPAGKEYIHRHGLAQVMKDAVHIVWATGGSMVPKDEMAEYYQTGKDVTTTTRKPDM